MLGRRGEKYAAKWLQKRGYRLLERNRTVGRDEADLIMLSPDDRTLVIVEVKTRRTAQPPPEANINADKRRNLSRLAARLTRRGRYAGYAVRFDVVTIIWPEGGEPELKHYEHAFEASF